MSTPTPSHPLNQSYHVISNLYAGEYPGDKDTAVAKQKLDAMHDFGIRHFIDLTEEGELNPYNLLLPPGTTYMRFPIKDLDAPQSVEKVMGLIRKINELMQTGGGVYIHCWGGVGRTGMIVACYFAEYMERVTTDFEVTTEAAIKRMRISFKEMPKSAYRRSPETDIQTRFVERFVASLKDINEKIQLRNRDRIRGSLMAGAAGDALGYAVEFLKLKKIRRKYGDEGITRFELTPGGKALISDDTQMTLFTANGMLMGMTRGAMRGVGGAPEEYVSYAYQDWYYTQTGKKYTDFKTTWLRDLPEMAYQRAPGITCLDACNALCRNKAVNNNSKGCGGIMRVAPMGLFMAVHPLYDIARTDEAGAKIAAVTHLHPLGFLPAAMLTHLLRRLVVTDIEEIKETFSDIALETIDCLDKIYPGKYTKEKRLLDKLTRKAVMLAANDNTDTENIAELGEGWVAEETWAIALYCAARHIDSMREAIIAAVNHDGDSDSTGSVCGNIMGAIYGYEAIVKDNLFCPPGKKFSETLELHDIILTIADDFSTGCIISEYENRDTPEKRRWFLRYCEMEPCDIAR